MTFAGARFSLWRANDDGVAEIKGDRKGIGYRRYPKETGFTDYTLPFASTDSFYMTTDGLIDQIGGPRGRSFGKTPLPAHFSKRAGATRCKSRPRSCVTSWTVTRASNSGATTSPCSASFRLAGVRDRCSLPNSSICARLCSGKASSLLTAAT